PSTIRTGSKSVRVIPSTFLPAWPASIRCCHQGSTRLPSTPRPTTAFPTRQSYSSSHMRSAAGLGRPKKGDRARAEFARHPGAGTTTIARLLAAAAGLHFVSLSAVFSGVADLKRAFEEARRRREAGARTLLFVDEVHRFNRAQQDGFLPVVEDGTIVLVGATTENPSFALNGALLSRCQVLVLKRLDDAALELLLVRAEQEGGQKLPLTEAARATLRAM